MPGIRFSAFGAEPGIDGDEGGREHPLTQQILQQIGNAERRGECVVAQGQSEVVGQYPLANQAGDPAQEDPAGDQRGMSAGSRGLGRWRERLAQGFGGGGRGDRPGLSSSNRWRN